MSSRNRQAAFGEGVQRDFVLDDAMAFQQLMLGLYGHRCAVTGRRADVEALEVFLFQPFDHGGMMVPSNSLVVEPAVASLLARGLILISDEYRAYTPHPEIVGVARPAEEPAAGRALMLPEDVAMWPEKAMIGYHRSLFRAQ